MDYFATVEVPILYSQSFLHSKSVMTISVSVAEGWDVAW